MVAKHVYAIVGAGVDLDGWYKVRLRRSDGREIKASKKRVAELRREGRIIEQPSRAKILLAEDAHKHKLNRPKFER